MIAPAETRRHLARVAFLVMILLGIILAGERLVADSSASTPVAPATASPSPSPARPNVILLMTEALEASHVSSYGYARATTPNLDALIASQGVRFQDCTSPSSWTFPAVAAAMTGYTPSRFGIPWNEAATTLPPEAHTLAEYLHNAGYYTAGFVTNYYASHRKGFDQGFDHFDGSFYNRPTSNEPRAEELNTLVVNWLQSSPWTQELSATQPLFLFLFYYDPHTWYNPRPPYDTLYDATYTGTLTASVYRDGQEVIAGLITPTLRDVEHLIALYDGDITYWDAQVGLLLDYLQTNNVLDNALIVATSDHGQMFGEHNKWVHGNSLYEEVLRVPLLIRYSGVITPGLVITTPVQSMDLMPTILDWVGISLPTGLQAISLRPLIEGRTAIFERDLFSEIDGVTDPHNFRYWIAPHVDLRAIRRGDWKLIHVVGDPAADELYQLHSTPQYETDNRLLTEPALARTLRQELLNWFRLNRLHLPLTLKR